MKQFVITPAMGKRLIGKAMAKHPVTTEVLKTGTLAIIAGSTNGYVAEEVLSATGQAEGFTRVGFRRGTVTPPGFDPAKAEKGKLAGDVILAKGKWLKGKTIFDVGDELGSGDVILKGANALDMRNLQAAVLIGDRKAGTAGVALAAAVGRRVRLIVPVGLEKRVDRPVMDLAAELNAPTAEGPGMLALPGEVFTELDAIALLTGAMAELLAAGGIYGAEGAVWIGVDGEEEEIEAAEGLIKSLADEPPCRV